MRDAKSLKGKLVEFRRKTETKLDKVDKKYYKKLHDDIKEKE